MVSRSEPFYFTSHIHTLSFEIVSELSKASAAHLDVDARLIPLLQMSSMVITAPSLPTVKRVLARLSP